MKIKFWDRTILFFGALLAVVAGGILFVSGLQVTGVFGEQLPLWLRVVCLVCGGLTVAFGVYLFVFPRKFSVRRHDFIVQKTDNGEVRIAVKAVENLVQKCIDTHEEIQVVSMWIHNGRDGVTVDLNVALANNISIPLAVASLQKQIKQYLVVSSGIEVKEVRVSVETTQDDLAAGPEPVEAEEEDREGTEKPAETSIPQKVPLHQRIFGRADQPVTVPEPPKEEDAGEPAETEDEAPAEEAEAEAAEEAPAEEATPEEAPAEEPKVEEEAAAVEEAEEQDAAPRTEDEGEESPKDAPSESPVEEEAAQEAETEEPIHE